MRELAALPHADDLLLQLLRRYGYTPHPLDWLPQANCSQLPAVFLPWFSLVHGATTTELTTENWSELPHALRLALLQQLRVQQKIQTHDLLLTCIEQENADRRLSYLEVLQAGLSATDEPLLRRGLADRSEKVRQLCRQYLTQLGLPFEEPAVDSASLQDLATWLQQERFGFLLASKKIVAKIGKNSVQTQNLLLALEQIPLPQIAKALDINVDTLIEQWSFVDNQGSQLHNPNRAFLSNAARYLTPPQLQGLVKRLEEPQLRDLSLASLGLAPIFARLSEQAQLQLLQQLLNRVQTDQDFAVVAQLTADFWPFMTPIKWRSSPLSRQLNEHLKQWQQAESKEQVLPQLARWLCWLGLVLPQDTAQLLQQELRAVGLVANSPLLFTLNFQLNLP